MEESGIKFNGNVALHERDRQPHSEMLLLKNSKSECSVLPAKPNPNTFTGDHDKSCPKGLTSEKTLLKLQFECERSKANNLSVNWDVRVNILLAYREGKVRMSIK